MKPFVQTLLAYTTFIILHQFVSPQLNAMHPPFSRFGYHFFEKYGPNGSMAIPKANLSNPDSYPEKFLPDTFLENAIDKCIKLLITQMGNTYTDNENYFRGTNGIDADSYIQKIIVNPGDRIFIMGDLHGSGHAFIKNLRDMEISDNMKLQRSNDFLVFTGDLIHRGRFGIENVYLATRIITANPGKVFWIRGNHETRNIIVKSHYGLEAECQKKYENTKLCEKIMTLFDLLPGAIYIGFGSFYIQASHSGIPATVSSGEMETSMDADTIQAINKLLVSGKNMECVRVSKDVGNQFKYNGFYLGEDTTIDLKIRGYFRFPLEILKSLLPEYVRVIIRGHQHNGQAVSKFSKDSMFTPLQNNEQIPLITPIEPVAIYTFMSCPEGLGGDDQDLARFDEENCNVRGYGVINVGNTLEEWTIQKFEWQENEVSRTPKRLNTKNANHKIR